MHLRVTLILKINYQSITIAHIQTRATSHNIRFQSGTLPYPYTKKKLQRVQTPIIIFIITIHKNPETQCYYNAQYFHDQTKLSNFSQYSMRAAKASARKSIEAAAERGTVYPLPGFVIRDTE